MQVQNGMLWPRVTLGETLVVSCPFLSHLLAQVMSYHGTFWKNYIQPILQSN